MSVESKRIPIPRWLVRTIWVGHRVLYSITGGRFGLRTPMPDRWGTLRRLSARRPNRGWSRIGPAGGRA